jgi:intracellular multiplication protein IcmQ
MAQKSALSLEQAKSIQEILNKLAQSPNFSQSTFLTLIQKQLIQLSEDFNQAVQNTYFVEEATPQLEQELPNHELVFISIYCSDGSNLSAWERVISNLPKQYISRPIYLREQDAQKMAKSRPIVINEGYVAVYVDKNAIFETGSDMVMQDKFGNQLLSLKDRAIDLKKVSFFWNSSKQYSLKEQALIFSKIVPDFIQED